MQDLSNLRLAVTDTVYLGRPLDLRIIHGKWDMHSSHLLIPFPTQCFCPVSSHTSNVVRSSDATTLVGNYGRCTLLQTTR
eukprot:7578146-Ditylum_brightwellii.AAC.2